MKLQTLNENKNPHKGTYVGVKLSSESVKEVMRGIKEIGIPNPVNESSMHITVIYSRKHLPDFEPRGKLKLDEEVLVDKLDTFPQQTGEGKVLVLKLKAPTLVARHEAIMKEHKATYDFDEYIPHVTLSYDCGDFDPKSVENLEKYFYQLFVDEEYEEELNLSWASDNAGND